MKIQNLRRILLSGIVAVTMLSIGIANPALAGTTAVGTASSTANINIPGVCGIDIELALTDLNFDDAANGAVVERTLVVENLGTATSQFVTIQGDAGGWTRVASPNTEHIAVESTTFDDDQQNNHVAFTGVGQPLADIVPDTVVNNRSIDIEVTVTLINLPASGALEFQIDLEVASCST